MKENIILRIIKAPFRLLLNKIVMKWKYSGYLGKAWVIMWFSVVIFFPPELIAYYYLSESGRIQNEYVDMVIYGCLYALIPFMIYGTIVTFIHSHHFQTFYHLFCLFYYPLIAGIKKIKQYKKLSKNKKTLPKEFNFHCVMLNEVKDYTQEIPRIIKNTRKH